MGDESLECLGSAVEDGVEMGEEEMVNGQEDDDSLASTQNPDYREDRFRVDRRKLEQLLQGMWAFDFRLQVVKGLLAKARTARRGRIGEEYLNVFWFACRAYRLTQSALRISKQFQFKRLRVTNLNCVPKLAVFGSRERWWPFWERIVSSDDLSSINAAPAVSQEYGATQVVNLGFCVMLCNVQHLPYIATK